MSSWFLFACLTAIQVIIYVILVADFSFWQENYSSKNSRNEMSLISSVLHELQKYGLLGLSLWIWEWYLAGLLCSSIKILIAFFFCALGTHQRFLKGNFSQMVDMYASVSIDLMIQTVRTSWTLIGFHHLGIHVRMKDTRGNFLIVLCL